jgi:hypothetical protein
MIMDDFSVEAGVSPALAGMIFARKTSFTKRSLSPKPQTPSQELRS